MCMLDDDETPLASRPESVQCVVKDADMDTDDTCEQASLPTSPDIDSKFLCRLFLVSVASRQGEIFGVFLAYRCRIALL